MKLALRVAPNAPRCRIERDARGLKVRIDAPPVDGAANERLVQYLAKEVFAVPRAAVRVVAGERGRDKIVEIDLDDATASERLASALGSGKA